MEKSKLFYNISEESQTSMMHCFHSTTKKYSNGEIISFFASDNKGIGIVESGSACVVDILPNGSRTILENLNEGDIFGGLFYFHVPKDTITVEATDSCLIRYIDYEHLIKRCEKACAHHSQLVSNVLLMIQDKTKYVSIWKFSANVPLENVFYAILKSWQDKIIPKLLNYLLPKVIWQTTCP